MQPFLEEKETHNTYLTGMDGPHTLLNDQVPVAEYASQQ